MDVGCDTEEDRRVTGNEVGGEYYMAGLSRSKVRAESESMVFA